MLYNIYVRLLTVLETLGNLLRSNSSIIQRLQQIEQKQDGIITTLADVQAKLDRIIDLVDPPQAVSLNLTPGPVEEKP